MTDALQAAANLLSTLLSRWTQTDRLLHLHTALDTTHGPDMLLAEQLRGIEGIGILNGDETNSEETSPAHGFRLELTALSQDAHLELKALIGQPVLLEMLTSTSRTNLRPFHGYITRVECVGSNGGVARYKLIIEPWIAFLGFRRDSTTYQDMTVFDIIESVFKDYEGQGKLFPAWRLDIADRTLYPKRSLTTQYQESDLAFVERLMNEEGLFYWFEHEGNAQSASLGAHTMVIADHNEAFKPNAQPVIHFTQPGATIQHDSIDRWRSERRWQTNAVEIVSWDYRSIDTRPVAAHSSASNSTDSLSLVSQDAPGVYSYEDRVQGQRIANNQLQALEARNKVFTGAGTVRTLSPGITFSLQGHADHDLETDDTARFFVILRVVHLAHNNLSADLQSQIELALGLSELAQVDQDFSTPDNVHAIGKDQGERPLYRNCIDVIRSSIPYRSLSTNDQGRLLHPKPTVYGQQTAIVVGSGGPIHTDRDHRVKVQFHWQRGQNSHSRLSHPSSDGHTGAPANEQAGTWVRVATPLAPIAGTNWGSHALPRVGQEVLVDFMEGDIDRPVVIGCLYNGRGQADAQSNQFSQGTGVATGNASAWFPGEQAGHAHPAALSGIKTQSMNASQSGGGAYNQLVFDDSPGQSRTVLQNHASPHQGTAELNLGHLRHQSDNQRLNPVGFGAELKTRHSAALRAGQGLLLSTHARPHASSTQLDSREALAQLEQSQQLQATLADTAQKHHARLSGEPAPDKLPAIAQMQNSITVVNSTATGASDGTNGGAGQVTAYSEPHLQLSSPAGIAASTPANVILTAGNTSSITAGQDINFAAQGNTHHGVKDGISLFTYGKATNASKPNQETGIKLHAASGKVTSQSQSDETRLTADKSITVASMTQSVTIAAPQHVLLTAGGAYIRIEGGNIEIHGPGTMAFNAGMKTLTGGKSESARPIALPISTMGSTNLYSQKADLSDFIGMNPESGQAINSLPYEFRDVSGRILQQGQTNQYGDTQRVMTHKQEKIALYVGDGDWKLAMDGKHDL